MRQNDFLKGYIMPSRPVWYGCNHLISKVTKAFREQHGLEAGPQVSAHRASPVRGRAKGLLQQSGVSAVLFPKPFAARRAGQTDPAASCVIVSLDLLPNSLGSRQHQAQGARFLLPSPPRLWPPWSPQSHSSGVCSQYRLISSVFASWLCLNSALLQWNASSVAQWQSTRHSHTQPKQTKSSEALYISRSETRHRWVPSTLLTHGTATLWE